MLKFRFSPSHSMWFYLITMIILQPFWSHLSSGMVGPYASLSVCPSAHLVVTRESLDKNLYLWNCLTYGHLEFKGNNSQDQWSQWSTSHQTLLVEIWWNSHDSTPSYDEIALVIPFAWLIAIEIAFVITSENQNKFYVEQSCGYHEKGLLG